MSLKTLSINWQLKIACDNPNKIQFPITPQFTASFVFPLEIKNLVFCLIKTQVYLESIE